MDKPKAQRLVALDGLRGVAAIAVLLHHSGVSFLPIDRGYLAVDLFFLLSGYVIARSYEAPLKAGLSLANYTVIRMMRLYPMLFLGGALGVSLYWTYRPDGYFIPDHPFSMSLAVLSQFSLIPFLATQGAFVFNGAQWSVVFEIMINFVHALFVRVLSVAVLGVLVAISAVALCLVARHYHELNVGWGVENFLAGIPRVGWGFFTGVLLYRLRHLWQHRVPHLHFAVIAIGLLVVIGTPDWRVLVAHSGARDAASALVAFPIIIVLGANARGWPTLAAALGTLSYPLYAIHTPLLFALFRIADAFGISGTGWGDAIMIAGDLSIVAAAYLVGRFVDEPLNAWRRRSRTRRQSSQPGERPVPLSTTADS